MPVATLFSPVVLTFSALFPVATLSVPVVFGEERPSAGRDVEVAGRCWKNSAIVAGRDVVVAGGVVVERLCRPDATLSAAGRVFGSVWAWVPMAMLLVAGGQVWHHRTAEADVVAAGEGPVEEGEGIAGGDVPAPAPRGLGPGRRVVVVPKKARVQAGKALAKGRRSRRRSPSTRRMRPATWRPRSARSGSSRERGA